MPARQNPKGKVHSHHFYCYHRHAIKNSLTRKKKKEIEIELIRFDSAMRVSFELKIFFKKSMQNMITIGKTVTKTK